MLARTVVALLIALGPAALSHSAPTRGIVPAGVRPGGVATGHVSACSGSYTNLTPCDSAVTKNANTSNLITITIHNNGTTDDNYTLWCNHTGTVVTCAVGTPSIYVRAHSSATKTVGYTTGAAGG